MPPPSRLYTRTGDQGRTGLGDGRRVRKSGSRVAALGEVDELNAALGLAAAWNEQPEVHGLLLELQRQLFELGAELADPDHPRITADKVSGLEKLIDRFEAGLPPLRAFILPGGNPASAQLHLARAVCRRAERTLWQLAEQEAVNSASLQYLNRLSDLLFVLARRMMPEEVPWKPES